MKNLTFIFLLSCIVSGCVQQQMVWVKPNAQQGEFEQVRYQCLQESQQYSSRGVAIANSAINGYQAISRSGVGTNDELFGACMNAKGWNVQNIQQSYADIPNPPPKVPCSQYTGDVYARCIQREINSKSIPRPPACIQFTGDAYARCMKNSQLN